MASFSTFEETAASDSSLDIKSLEKHLLLCQEEQKEVIKNILAVINKFKYISKNENIDTYNEVLSEVIMLYNVDLSSKLQLFNTENVLKIGECHGEKSKELIIKKEIKSLAKMILKIQSGHKHIEKVCPNYEVSNKEKEILDLMNELELLEAKVN